MGLKNINSGYILIATLSLLVFFQFTIINTIKTQNSELDSRIIAFEQNYTSVSAEIDELHGEITKLEQKISQLETELHSLIEEPSINSQIPEEWINQTILKPLNLTNTTLKDPYNKYHVSPDSLTWININRTQNQGIVTSGFNLTHHMIEFDFQLDDFTFGEGGNRRLITFWAISDTEEVNDTRSYTMLYAEQVTYRKGIYELIFHQKQNNENMFIDVGKTYELNISYHCQIIRYRDYAMYKIYTNSSKIELLYKSVPYELVEDNYQYIYLGYMYPPSRLQDLDITSSGKMSNIKINK